MNTVGQRGLKPCSGQNEKVRAWSQKHGRRAKIAVGDLAQGSHESILIVLPLFVPLCHSTGFLCRPGRHRD